MASPWEKHQTSAVPWEKYKSGERVDIVKNTTASNLPETKKELKSHIPTAVSTVTSMGGPVAGMLGGASSEIARKYIDDDFHLDQGPSGITTDAIDVAQEGLMGLAQGLGAKYIGKAGKALASTKPGQKAIGFLSNAAEKFTGVPAEATETYLMRGPEVDALMKRAGKDPAQARNLELLDDHLSLSPKSKTPLADAGAALRPMTNQSTNQSLLSSALGGAAVAAPMITGDRQFDPTTVGAGLMGGAALRSPLALKMGLIGARKVPPALAAAAAREGLSVPEYQALLKQYTRDTLGVKDE